MEKAKLIHGEKYDYSKSVYKNVDTKLVIGCPVHGQFEQTPYHHINRKQGCCKCKGLKISTTKRESQENFTKKANIAHNNKYDYSLAVYVNSHVKLTIICKLHGNFSQKPSNHLYLKTGCPKCGSNRSNACDSWLETFDDVIEKEVTMYIKGKKYKVDGFSSKTNTIYEYFGNFWHGNPSYFKAEEINPVTKTTFGQLYESTLNKIENIKSSEYNFVYIWGD